MLKYALKWTCAGRGLGVLLFSFWMAAQVGASQGQIVISEIMYHPIEEPAFNADGTPVLDLHEDVHEFVELHNPTAGPIGIGGWRLAGGIEYTFPAGARLEPGQYAVVAKNPKLLAAVGEYQLVEGLLWGPYAGQLSNDGETIRLRTAAGQIADEVSYSARFPWAISADAFGAGEDWTRIRELDYQYRGRSLERVSFSSEADQPANWVASPFPGNPSPGRANAVKRVVPEPVVVELSVMQAGGGERLIRKDQPVRIDCVFSAVESVSKVRLEYFVDLIDATNEVPARVEMLQMGPVPDGWYTGELRGFGDRTIVRYRVWADVGAGERVVSPRKDDPFGWHAFFVTPVRATAVNPAYDVFISAASLRILQTNISANPRRVTSPDPPGRPRASWNATQPAVFVHDGVVRDVRMRHHGSRYRREVGRRSYKLQFARYQPFNNAGSVFITDKDYQTAGGHALFRAAGLPTSLTRSVDLYMNNNARLVRLEQEEYDERMLERYHAEQRRLHPEAGEVEPGEIYKAVGFDGTAEGPYGNANGRQLAARLPHWTALQRYEWTFALQNHTWRGHTGFKGMVDEMWAARNAGTNQLRAYFERNWDVERQLTHMAVMNWMVPWDDTFHNFFLWQQRDGRWSQLPWDFDSVMNGQSSTASIFNGAPFAGPNYFKESFLRAFREDFRRRAWFLNNTVLHPDHLADLGINSSIRTWAVNRMRSVNTQLALGSFDRPEKPTHLAPLPGSSLFPVVLQASEYRYSTNPMVAHGMTRWLIREANGSYYEPVYQETTPGDIRTLVVPERILQPDQTYFWKCIFVAVNGHPSVASKETSFRVGPTADRLRPGIYLTEVMASNLSSVRNGNRTPDWVEIHNSLGTAQDLGGMTLTDELTEPGKFVFPPNTIIPPGGYLIVWCDAERSEPGLHSGFGLSANGDEVCLFEPGPNGYSLADRVRFGLQIADLSVSRTGLEWNLSAPSPGREGAALPLGTAGGLRINEWLADSGGANDWVELYNSANLPVALGGMSWTDGLEDPYRSPVRPLSFINGRSFVQLAADGDNLSGGDHLGFRLKKGGGVIGLFGGKGEMIDSVFYGSQAPGHSRGRSPDGGGDLLTFAAPTPGRPNSGDADGDGLADAWETLHGLNPADSRDSQIDADADGQSNVQEFIAGTNPGDGSDRLAVRGGFVNTASGSEFRIQFRAAMGRSYDIQFSELAQGGPWTTFAQVPSNRVDRWMEIAGPSIVGQDALFFRVAVRSGDHAP